MPITIKKSQLKYKNPDTGSYVGIDGFAERTTAEMVQDITASGQAKLNAINTAGATQLNTINTRATEVQASLPTSGEMEDMVAVPFVQATAYPVNKHVIQAVNGVNKLFILPKGHEANVAWEDTEKQGPYNLGDEITDLKAAIDNNFNYNDIPQNVAKLKLVNDQIAELATHGVTLTKINNTSFILNGTLDANFIINLDFNAYDLAEHMYYLFKRSDGITTSDTVWVQMGYFDESGTATQTTTINQFNTSVPFTFPSAAKKSRSYMRIGSGNTFNDVRFDILAFYEKPILQTVKSAIVDLSETLNAGSYTFEQGAVQTDLNKTYEQLKVESDTRVRTVTTIAVDPSLSYSVSSLNKDQYFSVVKFNAVGVSYGSSDGWVTDEYTFTGASYISIAVRSNKSNTNIAPADVYGIRLYLQNAVEALSSKTTEMETQCDENTAKLNKMISISGIVPDFVIGAYAYNRSSDTMILTTNAARLTADLRGLELAQGDSVGITDYTTYSIAFGDNGDEGGWYSGGYNTHDIIANNANVYPYIFLVKRNDKANISQTDIDAIKAQFHYTGGKEQINITEEFSEAINEVVADDGSKICNNDYLHFSFDDVAYCILNLVNNGASFDSLWDEPFFGMLKRLHDTYGAIFSLYIWDVANLANIPSKFKAEFMASSKWLKFGFHSYTEGSLADTSYNDAKTQYETFINYVFSKIGGVNSVDRIPRLNYFAGNVNALRALRDANCGCIGFLNTDDTRNTYYLTQEELTYLRTHSLWSDRTNGLQFVSTVMRLDWFVSGFSSQYDYNVPVEDNPYDELVYRYGQPAMADLYGGLIVFTHEWQTYSSGYVLNPAMVDRIEQVCRFANDYGYDFDYPQNRVENITSYAVGEIVIDNFTLNHTGEHQ